MTQIDEIDLKIAEILQRNASLTNLAISEQLRVSEATIRRRRTRLEEEGFIRIVCSANPTKLGFKVAVIIEVQAIKHLARLKDWGTAGGEPAPLAGAR